MEPKTYGLDTLALICAGRTGTTDEEAWIADIEKAMRPYYAYNDEKAEPRYEVRDGGLWRNSKYIAAAGTSTAELDVLEWQPIASSAKPALPVPFTACEFAAFTLAGMGIFAIERFAGLNDEDALNEDEIAALGRNGADAKEVLREALRLRLEAVERFGHNVAKEDEPPRLQLDDASTDAAAAWLLRGAQIELGSPAELLTSAAEPVPIGLAKATPVNESTTWFEVAKPYLVQVLREKQFATAKELYRELEVEAGSDSSPFSKGTGQHRNSLYLREIRQTVALKTIQNRWRDLRDAACQR